MTATRSTFAFTLAACTLAALAGQAHADITKMCYQKYIGGGAYVSVCRSFSNLSRSGAVELQPLWWRRLLLVRAGGADFYPDA